MKLIVDSMLGKLAKRLRLLGHDTAFDPAMDDRQLLKVSREEGRILITRDTGLAKIHGARVLLIKSTDLKEQLEELSKLTGIRSEGSISFSRCSECNTPVEKAAKEDVKDIVPEFVYKTQSEFSFCPKCRKAYWHGTHYDRLIKELKSI